ncbi:C40 family peptidase [Pseudonocardia acidicola]|uniref:C40 family peptidase n=1 Tax=Pseudonocardia acidicola TaxID=2724939 RepID=A0ABX1SEK2_9PSEU|nr:C40 family peptidase [Pseudonocardia acidicola]NMH99996.1 C40 family peptidase [Pseudonocardia acidicola]
MASHRAKHRADAPVAAPTRPEDRDHRDARQGRRGARTQKAMCAAVSATLLGATAAVAALSGSAQAVTPQALTQDLPPLGHDGPAPQAQAAGPYLAAQQGPAAPTALSTAANFQPVQVGTIVRDAVTGAASSAMTTAQTRAAAAARAQAAAAAHEQAVAAETRKQAAAGSTIIAASLTTPATAAVGGGAGAAALQAALTQIGKPYVWGGTGPDGFDCSGLVQWAFKQAGVTLPRTADEQSNVGTPVSQDQLQPGDLVFFYSPVEHVGIYVGNGKILAAPQPGETVGYSNMAYMPFHNARRL